MFYSVLLDGALVHLEAASGRLVRYGNNAHNLVAGLDKGVQRAHGEFRGAHIDNACFSEHTEEFTFCFAEPGFYQVHIEDAGVLDGLQGEPGADGRQDKGRYKLANKRRRGAIVGQALAGDVHHPVEHEEQHGDDGRSTQAAFFENGSYRRADEEQQQAGQRRGIFFPDFHIRAVNQVGIVGRIHDLSVGQVLVLAGAAGGIFQAAEPGAFAGPGLVRQGFHHRGGLCAPGGVQLVLMFQVVLPAKFGHVPLGAYIDQIGEGIVPMTQVLQVHGTDLLAVTGAVGVMEGVVFQRDHHFLIVETDALERQGGVPILAFVVLLVVHPVKELER